MYLLGCSRYSHLKGKWTGSLGFPEIDLFMARLGLRGRWWVPVASKTKIFIAEVYICCWCIFRWMFNVQMSQALKDGGEVQALWKAYTQGWFWSKLLATSTPHSSPVSLNHDLLSATLIARFMGPTWGPPGTDKTQVGPMLAPSTLLSGLHGCSSVISMP